MIKAIERVLPEIIALRHELHEHPEIRFEERWTSDRIAAFLDDTGLSYTRGHARGTGIVAVLQGAPGRTVALRADMDALEIQEETGLAYASRIPARMHACGHDGHMACLCGVAKTLAGQRGALDGTVKFIFQPAEELAGGGRFMVEEGVLDGVDAVFALHAWPDLPVGKAAVASGLLMASADTFQIVVRGKGGHAADPAAAVDPILVAAHVTTALQSIVSRATNPWEPAVVSVTRIEAGSASNVIPETAWMEGTFRALSPRVREEVRCNVARIPCDVARAFGAEAEVSFGEAGYPPLHNDPAMSAFARARIVKALGNGALAEVTHPYMIAEDFAFYLEKTPGAFIFLGNAPRDSTGAPRLHTPLFDFNDGAIPAAIQIMGNIAIDFLRGE